MILIRSFLVLFLFGFYSYFSYGGLLVNDSDYGVKIEVKIESNGDQHTISTFLETNNQHQIVPMTFANKDEFLFRLSKDQGFKYALYKKYGVNINKLFDEYFKQHNGPFTVFDEDDLSRLSHLFNPFASVSSTAPELTNKLRFKMNLDQLVNGQFSKGPNQLNYPCSQKEPQLLSSQPSSSCLIFNSAQEKTIYIHAFEGFMKKLQSEKESNRDPKNEPDLSNMMKNISDAIKDLKDNNDCSPILISLKDDINFLKQESNPFFPSGKIESPDALSVKCTDKLQWGAPCYTQRASCVSNQERNQLESKGWIYPRNEDKWRIQIPINYKAGDKILETTAYKYKPGGDFNSNFIESKKPIENITSTVLQQTEGSDIPELKERIKPKYSIDTQNDQFPLAEYPFFRPEDQCSTPVTNTQDVGGVCFQLACREHDYCFQSLPLDGKIDTDSLRKHFNLCNTKILKNLENLCETATSYSNKLTCLLGARLFYTGVNGVKDFGGQDGMGQDFIKSQVAEALYLKGIYHFFVLKYCKNTKDISNDNCNKAKKIMADTDELILKNGDKK